MSAVNYTPNIPLKSYSLSINICNRITEIARRAFQALSSLYHFITGLFCWKSKQVNNLPLHSPPTPPASQPAGAASQDPIERAGAAAELPKPQSPINPYDFVDLSAIFPYDDEDNGQTTHLKPIPQAAQSDQIPIEAGAAARTPQSTPTYPKGPQAAGSADTTSLAITCSSERAHQAAGAASGDPLNKAHNVLSVRSGIQKTPTQPRLTWLIPEEILERILKACLYKLFLPSVLVDHRADQRIKLFFPSSLIRPNRIVQILLNQAAGAAAQDQTVGAAAPTVAERKAAFENPQTQHPKKNSLDDLPPDLPTIQERKNALQKNHSPFIIPHRTEVIPDGIVATIAQNFESPAEEAGAAARTPPPNRRSEAATTLWAPSSSSVTPDGTDSAGSSSPIVPISPEITQEADGEVPDSQSAELISIAHLLAARQAAGAAAGEHIEEPFTTTNLSPPVHAKTATKIASIAVSYSIVSPTAGAGAASAEPVAQPRSSNPFAMLDGDLNIQKTIHGMRDLLGYADEPLPSPPLAAGAASSISQNYQLPISKASTLSKKPTYLNKISKALGNITQSTLFSKIFNKIPQLKLPSQEELLALLQKTAKGSRHLIILENTLKKTFHHVDVIRSSSKDIEFLWNILNFGQMAKSSPIFIPFAFKTKFSDIFNAIYEWPISLFYDLAIDPKVKIKDLSFYLPVIQFLTDGLEEIADAIDEKAPGVRDTLDLIGDYLTVIKELGQWITDEATKSDPDNRIDVLSKEFTERSHLIEALHAMYKKSDRAQSLIQLQNALNTLDFAAASAITYAQNCGSKQRKRKVTAIPSPKTTRSLVVEKLREDSVHITTLVSDCALQEVPPLDVAKKIALKEIHDGLSESLRKSLRSVIIKISSFSIPFIAGMLLPSLNKDPSNNSSLLTGAHMLLKKGVLQKTIEYTGCTAISYFSKDICNDIQEYNQSSNSYHWRIFGVQFLCAVIILLELAAICRNMKSLAIQASDLAPQPIKNKIASIKSRFEEEDPSYKALQASRAAARAERKKQPLLLDGTGLSFF